MHWSVIHECYSTNQLLLLLVPYTFISSMMGSCSAGTGEEIGLELLVDDFVTFYIAGKPSLVTSTF